MQPCAFISTLCALALCSAFGQEHVVIRDSRDWRQLFDPPFTEPQEIPSTSRLRKELFELLRRPVAQLAKQPVRFEGSLRTFKNWAFFNGTTIDEKVVSIRFPPIDNSDTVAWLRTRGGWCLVDYSAGHGDVFYAIWAKQYGVPNELLGIR